jgi:2-oxoglutarate dehydrogenase E2 component (dihydrolipoamide succinyltransferase)
MSIVEMKVPVIGESITEVTLSQWLKEEGEYVELDEPICEFESDKATLEFPAEAAGILRYVAAEGDDLEIGALVAKIEATGEKPAAKAETKETEKAEDAVAETPAVQTANYATGHPSPAAGKILSEANIDPAAVNGTGKDGRITKSDAEKAVANKPASPLSPTLLKKASRFASVPNKSLQIIPTNRVTTNKPTNNPVSPSSQLFTVCKPCFMRSPII